MKQITILIFLIFVLLAGMLFLSPSQVFAQTRSFDCGTVSEIPQTECEALLAIYSLTDGENWYNNFNWLVSTTPGNWYGVTVYEGHVTELRLIENHLVGSIPPAIGNLSELEVLSIHSNQISGNSLPKLGS